MAQQARWLIAQDTFSGDLPNGAGFVVTKGEHLLSTHPVVVLVDGERGILFKPEEAPPVVEEPAAKPSRRIGGKAQ